MYRCNNTSLCYLPTIYPHTLFLIMIAIDVVRGSMIVVVNTMANKIYQSIINYKSTLTHTYLHRHTRTQTQIHIRTHACAHTRTHYIFVYIRLLLQTYIYKQTHNTYKHTYYIYTHTYYKHTYTHIYTDT